MIWMLIGGSKGKFLVRREEVGWVWSMEYGLFERGRRKGMCNDLDEDDGWSEKPKALVT